MRGQPREVKYLKKGRSLFDSRTGFQSSVALLMVSRRVDVAAIPALSQIPWRAGLPAVLAGLGLPT